MGRIDLTDEEFKELMETLDEDNSNEIDCEAHFPRFDIFDVSSTLQEAIFFFLSILRPTAWDSGREFRGLNGGVLCRQ